MAVNSPLFFLVFFERIEIRCRGIEAHFPNADVSTLVVGWRVQLDSRIIYTHRTHDASLEESTRMPPRPAQQVNPRNTSPMAFVRDCQHGNGNLSAFLPWTCVGWGARNTRFMYVTHTQCRDHEPSQGTDHLTMPLGCKGN